MTAPATARPLRDLGLAITLLTVVPLRVGVPDGERPDVAGYFPAAGLLLGLAAGGLLALPVVRGVPFPVDHAARGFLLAALTVAVWGVLTRLLHWDALADVADGYWGGHEPSRRLEIMADPHVGAFGAAAIGIVALIQVAAIAVLLTEGFVAAVIAAPVLARYAAVAGAWFGTPAKATGLAVAVCARPRPHSALFAAALLVFTALLAWPGGAAAAGVVAASLVVALGVPHVLAQRFGGVTGDVLGASVVLTETAALVLFALVS